MNVGVLAFQGDVIEHEKSIKKLGHNPVKVRECSDLRNIDAIILPGGESTTIGRLLRVTGLLEPLKLKIQKGLPVWGTCAGMILLAKDIENQENVHLGVMNIKVKRNAFGRQIDSFETTQRISEISEKDMKLVFIRAPYITEAGKDVEILCKVKNKIVAAKENNIFVTSFHPELTENLEVLDYFLNKITE